MKWKQPIRGMGKVNLVIFWLDFKVRCGRTKEEIFTLKIENGNGQALLNDDDKMRASQCS